MFFQLSAWTIYDPEISKSHSPGLWYFPPPDQSQDPVYAPTVSNQSKQRNFGYFDSNSWNWGNFLSKSRETNLISDVITQLITKLGVNGLPQTGNYERNHRINAVGQMWHTRSTYLHVQNRCKLNRGVKRESLNLSGTLDLCVKRFRKKLRQNTVVKIQEKWNKIMQ